MFALQSKLALPLEWEALTERRFRTITVAGCTRLAFCVQDPAGIQGAWLWCAAIQFVGGEGNGGFFEGSHHRDMM